MTFALPEWVAFIAVFMSEHSTVRTSRRGRLWTKWSVYVDGDENRPEAGT